MSVEEPKADGELRREVEWRVTLRCPSWEVARQLPTANASQGEIFIRTAKPPRAGARVELDVELPDGSTLVLAGECVHSIGAARDGRPAGLSVRFDVTHAVDLALLAEITRAPGTPRDPRRGADPAPPEQLVLSEPIAEEPLHWSPGAAEAAAPPPADAPPP
ncbi:MAG TPA: hypothetical protein VGQ83_27410, partial [Polyangia bacterium]